MVWKLIRHRRGQAFAIAALAALITACAAFAPLYDRAMQQALVQERLSAAPVQISGLRLTARNTTAAPDSMTTSVPDGIRGFLREPTPSGRVAVDRRPGATYSPTGPLTWREGFCDHVTFRDGACPKAPLEVAVSEADAANFDWKVGTRIPVAERVSDPTLDPDAAPRPTLRVVGVYVVQRGDYWFGRLVSGRSGSSDPDTGQPQTDDLLTDAATVTGADAPAWLAPTAELDFPLDRPAVGVDELLRIGRQLTTYLRQGQVTAGDLSQKSAPIPFSGLPDIAEEVAGARDQAHVIVPLLMVQLGLLALVVLWLVLGAATEQRRPEIALARLRGRGARGAARTAARRAAAGRPGRRDGGGAGRARALVAGPERVPPGVDPLRAGERVRGRRGGGRRGGGAGDPDRRGPGGPRTGQRPAPPGADPAPRLGPRRRRRDGDRRVRNGGRRLRDRRAHRADRPGRTVPARPGRGPAARPPRGAGGRRVRPAAARPGPGHLRRQHPPAGPPTRHPPGDRHRHRGHRAPRLLRRRPAGRAPQPRRRGPAAERRSLVRRHLRHRPGRGPRRPGGGGPRRALRHAGGLGQPAGRPPARHHGGGAGPVPPDRALPGAGPGRASPGATWTRPRSTRSTSSARPCGSGSARPADLGRTAPATPPSSGCASPSPTAGRSWSGSPHWPRATRAADRHGRDPLRGRLRARRPDGPGRCRAPGPGPRGAGVADHRHGGCAGATYDLGGADQWQPADEDLEAGTMAPDPSVDRADLLAVDVAAEGGIELRMPHAALPARLPRWSPGRCRTTPSARTSRAGASTGWPGAWRPGPGSRGCRAGCRRPPSSTSTCSRATSPSWTRWPPSGCCSPTTTRRCWRG